MCKFFRAGAAQVQCYKEELCNESSFVKTTATIKDCCLGQKYDGLYYLDSSGNCIQCIGEPYLAVVHTWLDDHVLTLYTL